MNWESHIKGFKSFLSLEKSLSKNSITAYTTDVEKLALYLNNLEEKVSPTSISHDHLKKFIEWINESGVSTRTQTRIISGIKAFFRYLLLEDVIDKNPTELLESPKIGRKLPDTLSFDEISDLINSVDLSNDYGQRNKAIIEVLYSCGLRVSELINLKISDLHFKDSYIRVIGKGNKERLNPIGEVAIKQITLYIENYRSKIKVQEGYEDILFLNNRGAKLTRVMIFLIIKKQAEICGFKKSISPHTLRHSFASHLVDEGADLRAIQEMLGHESITTTEIYTHLNRRYLFKVVDTYHPRSIRAAKLKEKEDESKDPQPRPTR